MKYKLTFFILLSWALISSGTPTEQTKIDSLRQLLLSETNDSLKFTHYSGLITTFMKVNKDSALYHSNQAIQQSKSADKQYWLAHFHNLRGLIYYDIGQGKLALKDYQKALSVFKNINDQKGMVKVYTNLGNYHGDKANYEDCKKYYKKALHISESLKDKKYLTKSIVNLGTIYIEKGEYKKALTYYLRSKRMVDSLQLKSIESIVLSNLAVIYYRLGKEKKTIHYFKRSLSQAKKQGKTKSVIRHLTNLSAIYGNVGKTDTAFYYINKAHELAKVMGSSALIGRCLSNKAELYAKTGKTDKALHLLTQAFEIRKKLNDKNGLVTNYVTKANIYIKRKQYERAEQSLKKALELSNQINTKNQTKLIASRLAELYKKQGQYKLAYEHYQLYGKMKDSIFSEQKTKQIEEMQAKYEADKKEKEIKMLQQQNKIQELEVQRQQTWMYAAIGGVFMLLLLTGMLYNRFRVKHRSNKLLTQQKSEIEEKNSKLNRAYQQIEQKNIEITSSIEYASHIQEAILPEDDFFNNNFQDHFILYQPKDIIGGDFYWTHQANKNNLIWAAADCTGHGVPGALMSMIASSLLNEIVIEKQILEPARILDHLREGIIHALKQKGRTSETQDGLDIALCRWNKNNHQIQFAGANNPLYVVSGSRLQVEDSDIKIHQSKTSNLQLTEIPPDKQPVGIYTSNAQPFEQKVFKTQPNDRLYTFSDGLPDQFGGPKGKKFTYRRFRKTLLKMQSKSLTKQGKHLKQTLKKWQGKEEQLDDILVMGVRV